MEVEEPNQKIEICALPSNIKLQSITGINFTSREVDVIACIIGGRSSKKIATTLSISSNTVAIHLRNIMLKLGCNSRESIIDFIEKSANFTQIKQHYANLLIHSKFEQALKKLASTISLFKIKSLILYYKTTKAKDPFISQLEKHLNLAGVKTISKIWEKDKTKAHIHHNITEQQVNHLVYSISYEFIERLSTVANDFAAEIAYARQELNDKAANITFLCLDEQAVAMMHNMLPNVLHIDLATEQNYYYLVFALLKQLLPVNNIDQIIQDFKQQYSSLADVSVGTSNEIKEFPKKENCQIFKDNLLLKWLVSLILLGGIGIAAFFLKNLIFADKSVTKLTTITNTMSTLNSVGKDKLLGKPLKTWPQQLPAHDNQIFIDRKLADVACLEYLHKILHVTEQQTKVLVLHGFGGVGKTQLARHYIHSNQASATYSKRIWFAAETKEILDNEFLEFAKAVGILENHHTAMEQIRSLVVRWLEEHSGWLLVFDNTTDYKQLLPYLPRKGGSILITSRYAIWPPNMHTFNVLPMQETEAIKLVQTFSGKNSTNDKKLVKNLGYLPLALAQAASYMRVYGKTAAEYMTLYKRCQEELLAKDLRPYGMEHEPVAITWNNSLNAINNATTAKLENVIAKEFLVMSAYLAAEKIPKILLEQLIKQHKIIKDEEIILDEIVIQLLAHSLISREDDGKSFNMHRLLQTTIRNQQNHLLAEEIIVSNALDIMVQLFTKNTISVANFQRNYDLLPHVNMLLKYAKKYMPNNHIKLQIARLLNVTAYFYAQTGLAVTKKADTLSRLAKKYCEELVNMDGYESNCDFGNNETSLKNKAHYYAQQFYTNLQSANLPPTDKKLLPIIYASVLYTYGRTYFYINTFDITKAKMALYSSKCLSELIEKHSGEKIFYKIFAEARGLLLIDNEQVSSKEQLIHHISRYKKLLIAKGTYTNEDGHEIVMDTDVFFKTNCLQNMLKKYTHLAKIDISLATDGVEVAQELLNLAINNHQYLTKMISCNELELLASYYKTIGGFYAAYGDAEKAEMYLQISNTNKLNPSLVDVYYGLAKLHLREKKVNLAQKNINIYLELGKLFHRKDKRFTYNAEQLKEELRYLKNKTL